MARTFGRRADLPTLSRATGALKAVRDHLLWSKGKRVPGVFGTRGVITDPDHLLDLVEEALR